MPHLYINKDAEADLEQLWEVNPRVAARIAVLLQELQVDDDLLDRLTQHDYGQPRFSEIHVSKWFEQWNQGRDLWRVKIWDLERLGPQDKYRIIYAFMPQQQHYHVLAIAPRDFNYEADHPITQRILKSYKTLCDR